MGDGGVETCDPIENVIERNLRIVGVFVVAPFAILGGDLIRS